MDRRSDGGGVRRWVRTWLRDEPCNRSRHSAPLFIPFAMETQRLRRLESHVCAEAVCVMSSTGGSARGSPIEVFDPHFHIWDTLRYADPVTCFIPTGAATEGVYDAADFEKDWRALPCGFVHTGGVFVEAISCCYKDMSAAELAPYCLKEAEWVSAQLAATDKEYYLAPTACLEDPAVETILQQLARDPAVKAIRQALNVAPDWPRNGENGLGELLDNPQFVRGYAQLAKFGLGFEMQLNPHQYLKGAELAASNPAVPVVINHLGTPLLKDLKEDGGAVFWEGMTALAAAGDHVYIKISMLGYIDPEWDRNPLVVDAVLRVIELFGAHRSFFASNYPVDNLGDGYGHWTPDRLYPAFLNVVKDVYDENTIRDLFAGNVRKAYRV